MKLSIGDKAPEFTLPSSDKEMINLSDYKGKNVVVLFFPLAFTGVCTAELCSVSGDLNAYAGLDAEVIGISVDSPFSLAHFKERENIDIMLLSDFNKEVSRAYGSLYEEFVFGMRGVSMRSAFIVDSDGKIRYHEVLENVENQPNFDAIKHKLEELKNE